MTSEDVAGTLEAARASLLAIVPELGVDLPGLSPYPASSSTPIEGRRFRTPGLRLRSTGPRSSWSARRRGGLGEFRTAARFDESVAVMRYPDGYRVELIERKR